MDSMTRTHAQRITATTTEEAQRLIDIVVEELRHLAANEGTHGILVTKTGPGEFTIELSENVPYGITEEAVADLTES